MEPLEEKCRNLAARIGIGLSFTKDTFSSVSLNLAGTIWRDGKRKLPSSTFLHGWSSAWDVLQTFRRDLWMWKHGIGEGEVHALQNACEGVGKELYEGWVEKEDDGAGLILCDWLEENGQEAFGRRVREKILGRV